MQGVSVAIVAPPLCATLPSSFKAKGLVIAENRPFLSTAMLDDSISRTAIGKRPGAYENRHAPSILVVEHFQHPGKVGVDPP